MKLFFNKPINWLVFLIWIAGCVWWSRYALSAMTEHDPFLLALVIWAGGCVGMAVVLGLLWATVASVVMITWGFLWWVLTPIRVPVVWGWRKIRGKSAAPAHH